MPCIEGGIIAASDLQRLARIAVHAVRDAVAGTAGGDDDVSPLSARLRDPGASFVTLRQAGALRGCIGTLEPRRALVDDVAANARAAALRDPRFRPLQPAELATTELEVAVLGPPVAVAVASAQELYALLRPGIDGLIIEHAGRSATYLPSVWQSLPEPQRFVAELRRKAGIENGIAVKDLTVHRYTAQYSAPWLLRL